MITPRLEMILRHIEGKSCADIGTDHAYIPIKLAEKGIRVIATDIRPGPLEMGRINAEKHGRKIEFRLGGGLSKIAKNEVETIIIAGMGGEMIEKIISEDEEKARSSVLILQPMNSQYELRRYLFENNFRIEKEDIAIEGFKVYNLMVVKSGASKRYEREIDLHLPKMLYSHEVFPKLLEKKKREFVRIYEGLMQSAEKKTEEIEKMRSLICDIEEIEGRKKSETI